MNLILQIMMDLFQYELKMILLALQSIMLLFQQ